MMFLHFCTNDYMNHMCEISSSGLKQGKLGVIFTLANTHSYCPMSGSWLEACSDGVHRCNNPPTPYQTCHKTTSYRHHN